MEKKITLYKSEIDNMVEILNKQIVFAESEGLSAEYYKGKLAVYSLLNEFVSEVGI